MALPCDCCAPEEACYALASTPPAFFFPLGSVQGGVTGPPGTFTYPNFAGSGVTVTVVITGDGSVLGLNEIAVDVSPPRLVHTQISFSQPVYLRRVGMTDLDFPGLDEQAGNFSPQRSGVYGQKVNQACGATFVEATPALNPLGCVKDSVNNGTGGVLFPAPLTSTVGWDVSRAAAGAGHFVTELGFDLVAPQYGRAYRCIDPESNAVTWYNTGGGLIPTADVLACPPGEPASPILPVADFTLVGAFFADGPNEYLCNIAPAPASFAGMTSVPPCLQPTVGAPTVTWNNVSSAEMDYGPAAGVGGAVFIRWTSISQAAGNITWPGPYSVPLTPGQFRDSNPLANGGYARFSYISGFTGAGAPQFEPDTTNIRLHTGGPLLPVIRYRLEFFA